MTEFVICCGYKGYDIKEYFATTSSTRRTHFDLTTNKMEILRNGVESWNVTLIDTGENSMTGGRLKRIKQYVCGRNVSVRRMATVQRRQCCLARSSSIAARMRS